jgi:DNA-binding NarL/FixJ family response regulator
MNTQDTELSSIKLLVICDDDWCNTPAQIRALLDGEPQFELLGITKSGYKGIELARRFEPEIVLIDTGVDINAIACTCLVKEVSPRSRVLIMSTATDAEYLKKAMQEGVRFFLGKPLDKDEFVSTIRHVLK